MKSFIEATINSFCKLEGRVGKHSAFLYMFLSTFFFSVLSLFVKYSKHIPPYQVIFSRAFINVLLCYAVILNTNSTICPKNSLTHKLLVRRGIMGGGALSLYFHSIYFLPLSIVSVLQRINPLWVGILGALFYNEPYTFNQMLSTVVSFTGVLFIIKPSFIFGNSEEFSQSNEYLIGMALALMNSVLQSLISLTIRELKNRSNIIVVVFYFNFFNLIFAGVGQFFEDSNVLSLYDWFLMVIIGILGWVGQLLRARSLFLEKAFILSIIAYFQVFFSYFFDIYLLDEVIDSYSLIGIIVIMLSMGFLIYSGAKD